MLKVKKNLKGGKNVSVLLQPHLCSTAHTPHATCPYMSYDPYQSPFGGQLGPPPPILNWRKTGWTQPLLLN